MKKFSGLGFSFFFLYLRINHFEFLPAPKEEKEKKKFNCVRNFNGLKRKKNDQLTSESCREREDSLMNSYRRKYVKISEEGR